MLINRKRKVKFYGINLKIKFNYYAILLIAYLLLMLLSMFIEFDYFKKIKESIVINFLISIVHEYIISELSFIESQRIKAKLKKVIRDNKLFIKNGFLITSLVMKFYTKEKNYMWRLIQMVSIIFLD